MKTLLLDPLLF